MSTRTTRLVTLVGSIALLAGLAAAQQNHDPPRIDDRRLGEEEQIQRRLDWFYSTRRAGTTSGAERARLRKQAVEQTAVALERQRALRAAGGARQENFWVAMGPSPSRFGGWSFGNVSGRISSIAADWSGDVLYLGTASGGVWKSTNDGLSWTQLFDTAGTMTIGTVAVDPNDPNVLWVGTGENHLGCESYFGIGLMRSADGGATWESRNGTGGDTLDDLASFANVVIDPRDSNHVITGGRIRGCVNGFQTDGGLYTSDDGGQSWTQRISAQVYEIAQDPSVLDVYWAGTNAGIYKSSDNGVSWSLQTASGLPINAGRAELAIAPSDSNVVYALFSSGPQLWRTTNGGASWSEMASGSNACDGQCWYNMVLRVHRTNPDIVYRGTIRIFKSTDGGSVWSDLSGSWGASQTVHQDMHHLLMHPTDTDTFYAGGDGGIWKSINGGNSFTNLNGNLNITQFYAIGVEAGDPGTVCGGSQDNSSLARTGGDVWDLQAVTGDGFVCHFAADDPDYAYITSYPSGGYPRVSRSTNGVLGSFSGITAGGSGIIQNDRISWVTPYLLDPVTPTTLYLGTHRAYRSDDRGSNWSRVGPDDLTNGSGSLIALEVNRNFPDIVYSGSGSGRVWRSTNRGDDWTDITAGLPARSINDIAADPSDPDRAFAVVGGFNTDHLWEWTLADGWSAAGAGLPNVPANSVLLLSGLDVMVGTDTGVFRSSDSGQTVVPFMDGLPQGLVVTDLKYNQQQDVVTAGTYGRGAWQVPIAPVGPILLFDSIELPPLEIDGDGDENIEPGETWAVRALLRNGGGDTALGVNARLNNATPGLTILDGAADFGDIDPGTTVGSIERIEFSVDPSFPCGDPIVFDLVDVTSTNPPGDHADRLSAFSLTVLDEREPDVPISQLDENFDAGPFPDWTHEGINEGVPPCESFPYFDQWQITSKDAAHGDSYHCGSGPGGTYGVRRFAWLYHGGKDSENGPGIDVPNDGTSAILTLVHWYDTVLDEDGGVVLIDAEPNDQDVYVPLVPVGGYPGTQLHTGFCNAMEGSEAFQGSSGGWVTSEFDLTPYLGDKIYLAFVFASDRLANGGEGWYIDEVRVETLQPGDPVCQIVAWPGTVPPTAIFERQGDGTIEASWGDSCNAAELGGQTYAVQAGDLDALRSGAGYAHAAVDGLCDHTPPATFTPGAGNEYYLVIPHEGTHEGGSGVDSSGAARPSTDATCGLPRVAVCP